MAVAVASDSTLYQTHVFAASHGDMNVRLHKRHTGNATNTWGDRPVLLLLGIRLGIEGVNPIYYDTIKVYLYCHLSNQILIDSNSFCIRFLNRSG